MKRVLMLSVMMMVLSVGDVNAGGNYESGNSLLQKCKSEPDLFYLHGICTGYILGVAEALDGPERGLGNFRFCTPEGVTNGQLKDVVVKWLQVRPQHRHFTGSSLIAAALRDAFPCK